MTKIEAGIRKRIKKFKPFDPEKLKAQNDKMEKECPFCKSGESHFEESMSGICDIRKEPSDEHCEREAARVFGRVQP
jgi:hypothetical protein